LWKKSQGSHSLCVREGSKEEFKKRVTGKLSKGESPELFDIKPDGKNHTRRKGGNCLRGNSFYKNKKIGRRSVTHRARHKVSSCGEQGGPPAGGGIIEQRELKTRQKGFGGALNKRGFSAGLLDIVIREPRAKRTRGKVVEVSQGTGRGGVLRKGMQHDSQTNYTDRGLCTGASTRLRGE